MLGKRTGFARTVPGSTLLSMTVSVIAVMALAGCVPSASGVHAPTDAAVAHTSTASPTTSPSPTPASDTLTIVLDADALVVQNASGAAVRDYPYNGGATDAIAALTSILGAPVSSTYVPPGKCWSNMTTIRWNTLRLMYYGQDPAATRLFMLDAVNTPPTTVTIASPHGARVGGSWSTYFVNVADHLTKTAEYQGQKLTSVVDSTGTDGPRSGAIVSAIDGVITTVAAPSSLDADC